MTHLQQIKAHLDKGQPINPMQAFSEYGCFRLGARIHELKQAGYPVKKRMIEVENRRGDLCRVAEYRRA